MPTYKAPSYRKIVRPSPGSVLACQYGSEGCAGATHNLGSVHEFSVERLQSARYAGSYDAELPRLHYWWFDMDSFDWWFCENCHRALMTAFSRTNLHVIEEDL